MIQTILTKILEELNKENPKLDYIRGMVEVLLAMQVKEPKVTEVEGYKLAVPAVAGTITSNIPPSPLNHPELPMVSSLKTVQDLAKLE